MTILSGWREQYDRLRRSRDRLSAIAGGRDGASSDEARDALIHFFQDGWHLKDWLANDATVGIDKGTIEAHVNATHALRLGADIANGTKHFGLDPDRPSRTGDSATAITSQDVTVRPVTVGSGNPPRPLLHAWRVTSCGKVYDALALADDVVREWDQWLQANGLL